MKFSWDHNSIAAGAPPINNLNILFDLLLFRWKYLEQYLISVIQKKNNINISLQFINYI